MGLSDNAGGRTGLEPRWTPQIEIIESALESSLNDLPENAEAGLISAMRYAVGAGGKRLRPRLLLATVESLGLRSENALDAACAVELVHCASLVLDDLPAMDDASLRRGRRSVHLEFGEATAILVTHGLLAEAFRLIASNCRLMGLGGSETAEAVAFLATQVGVGGMVGGQAMDLSQDTVDAPETVLEEICRRKTASLICACVRIGGLLGRASDEILEALDLFAEKFGIAFQIRDDILDVLVTEEAAGKNVRQDQSNATLARRLGVDEARLLAESFERQALSALEGLKIDSGALKEHVLRHAD